MIFVFEDHAHACDYVAVAQHCVPNLTGSVDRERADIRFARFPTRTRRSRRRSRSSKTSR
jgi:hypothetical protein